MSVFTLNKLGMRKVLINSIFTVIVAVFALSINAQDEANYDETRVPQFQLPELLQTNQNVKIKTAQEWQSLRREELYLQFQEEMFGVFPDEGLKVDYIVSNNDLVFDGRARRMQVIIQVSNPEESLDINLLIYLPTKIKSPAPIFIGLNFYGNHTIHNDPGIIIPQSWSRNSEAFEITNNRPTAKSRGMRASRWQVDTLLKAGFGLATIYYGDIDPDFDDNFENGIHSLLRNDVNKNKLSSISAWSWGLSRAMDLFEQERSIDHTRVAVIGHSRLGKTSLWAGASDSRFAMVISNNSGCGGAAISRRRFGETVSRINHSFPHWFCDNFNQYSINEDSLPFDQHGLLALAAPRPIYVASASEDLWADPRGEFIAAREASKVYELYELKSLVDEDMPESDQPKNDGHVGYHLRDGKHDINLYDWQQYISFAKMHLK